MRPLYLKADAGKIPELKRVIVGYEDNIAMERTLEEALGKIFTGLSREPEDMVQSISVVHSSSLSKSVKDQKLILSKSDYENIRRTYRRILESQGKLDQSLALYRKELEGFGNLLEDTKVSPQVKATTSP